MRGDIDRSTAGRDAVRGRIAPRRRLAGALAALLALLVPVSPRLAQAEPTLNFYGVPGLIDMPSAEAMPDARFAVGVASFGGITRSTLSFQIAPRLTGSFRYSRYAHWNADGFDTYYDRSFDLRLLLLTEGRYRPAVTLGLQDFLGTGLSSAEYLVATKSFADRLKLTVGLGWGRLGSAGSIGHLGTRPAYDPNSRGGTVDFGHFFRGDVAPFLGVEWAATPRLSLKAEYSSDAYDDEVGSRHLFRRRSPVNLGFDYALSPRFHLGGYYLYGTRVGLQAVVLLDPGQPAAPGTTAPAPVPVVPRDPAVAASWGTAWDSPDTVAGLRAATARALAAEHLEMDALRLTATSATVRIRNPHYDAEPMALGRTFRILSVVLPPSVEVLTVIPVVEGIPASAVTLSRSEIERDENAPDGTRAILAAARLSDAPAPAARADLTPGAFPRFDWSLGPYSQISMFDPAYPLLYQVGLQATARYEPVPGLVFSGVLRQRLAGNFRSSHRSPSSVLPHVRTDSLLYQQQGRSRIESLTAAYYFRPGHDLYGRITAGYLEQQYAGLSAELLWKQVERSFALGVEVDVLKQRAFDGGFGMRDYGVTTGHVTGYYDFGRGHLGRISAGRYLAGDWGATVELDRTFANGWSVGAYATFTDVSFDDFGEGSFDKGIRFTIPLSYVLGRPTRRSVGAVISPITRDGGQRVNVDGRLYDLVKDYHDPSLQREWGMFWR